jgi:hypothetical protein
MRRHIVPLLVAGSMIGLLIGASALAGDASAKKSAKSTMSRYLIISPHTQEECLDALDKISAEGASTLNKFDFGCKAGDHTGYAIVMASNEEDALKIVPENIRDKAKAIKLTKFTAKDIQMAHQSMK